MKKLIFLTPSLFLLAACASTANVPPKVSWGYGGNSGEGVQYPGAAPKYSFSYGAGADVPVSSGATPTMSYGYGAEGTTGDMVQMTTPTPNQQVAQPAAPPNPNHHS